MTAQHVAYFLLALTLAGALAAVLYLTWEYAISPLVDEDGHVIEDGRWRRWARD